MDNASEQAHAYHDRTATARITLPWTRSAGRILALFAALLVSLTLTAAASANVSFTKSYGWGVSNGASQFETCTSTCQAGIQGGGAGQLHYPDGTATDSSGDVYVADQSNQRIDEFSAAGAFIKAYGWGVSDGASQFEICTSTCQAGIAGGGAGQFYNPRGVATDSSGDVYVADTDQARIEEFSAAGAFIKAYGWGVSDGMNQFETCTSTCRAGREGYGAGEFSLYGPTGIATDPSGNVYVTDESIDRIEEFSPAGAFIKAYGWGVSNGASQFETCTSTCQQGIDGTAAGQLGFPEGVATDRSGNVYVADAFDGRIDEFSAAGAFIKAYGWGVSDGMNQFEICTSTCQDGLQGGGAGEFDTVFGIGVATDPSGDVYVADSNNRIDEFSAASASYTLSVSLAGTGKGSVSGSGISCPGACVKNYAVGTVVRLTAKPSAGSSFAGWSGGGCSGTGTCTVTMSANRAVTASFRLGPPGTKITKVKISSKHHQAKLSFTAIGTATGFQCALVKEKPHHKQPKPHFARCRSPKAYKHLKPGKYTFEVRAFNAAGATPTPATKSFTIH